MSSTTSKYMEKKLIKGATDIKLNVWNVEISLTWNIKKKHEELCHNKKTIRVKCVGSPANPFEAAAIKKRKKDDILPIPSSSKVLNEKISSRIDMVTCNDINLTEENVKEKHQEDASSNIIINLHDEISSRKAMVTFCDLNHLQGTVKEKHQDVSSNVINGGLDKKIDSQNNVSTFIDENFIEESLTEKRQEIMS